MLFSTLSPEQAAIGIAWALAAFSFKNIGYVLQKAGVNKSGLDRTKTATPSSIPKTEESNQTSIQEAKTTNATEEKSAGTLLKSKVWWIGQLITMLGAFSLIIAYGTDAPLPLIMPFMGVGLIISIVFCKYYLKEQVSKNEWISSIIIILGIVLVTLVYQNLPAQADELHFYYDAYIKPESLVFFAIAFGGLIIGCVWSIKNHYKHASIIFGIAAGDIGGTTLLFQSPFSRGITILTGGIVPLESGFWWMFIFGVIGFAVGGVLAITFENIGFMHGEGVLVAPLYSTFQMLFPIIGGIVVFDQWNGVEPFAIILQLTGIIIITLGTFFLSYSNNKKKKQ
jgi:hypothetical protein